MKALGVLIVMGVFFVNSLNMSRSSEFIPTDEWKEILPGQIIPPGLHVRQNLQTGLTEARLMDDKSNKSYVITNNNITGIALLTQSSQNRAGDTSGHHSVKNRQRFRSYEEIKKDFHKMNVGVRTDAEIIHEICLELKDGNVTNERLEVLLEDLSYYLHQIDNAKIFANNGNFPLILRLLLHPDHRVKKKALQAVGAAIQGNSEVKAIALREGILEQLHYILKANLDGQNYTKSSEILLGGVLTLGALLRHFPLSQKQFFFTVQFQPSGYELLSRIASLDAPHDQAISQKLRVRVITLLTDLYNERLTSQSVSKENPTKENVDAWNIYAGIPFEEGFVSSGFCGRLRFSLQRDIQGSTMMGGLSTSVNHDLREKVVTACLKFVNLCDWASLGSTEKHHILTQLDLLIDEYELRSKDEVNENDFYFTDMLQKCQKLKSTLQYESDFQKTDL
ncbi:unnamed protein product [Trichobilharzia szidati]|nr:unnamed protein product [Trichobilharzia szidati]